MPTMPLMIATFAYLNSKRFEPDTFVIDVRVSCIQEFIWGQIGYFRRLKRSAWEKLTPYGGRTFHWMSFDKLFNWTKRISKQNMVQENLNWAMISFSSVDQVSIPYYYKITNIQYIIYFYY